MNHTGFRRIDQDRVLRLILEGTAAETGTAFFRSLVKNLALAIATNGAWVTEYLPQERRLRSLAFWNDGAFIEHYEYSLEGTPCEKVVEGKCLVHVPERVVSLYPGDPDLEPLGAVSYIGVPLLDVDGRLLGHLAALDRRPMPLERELIPVLELFAARAAAEHRRCRAEWQVRCREEQLSRLLEAAMDAILVLDSRLRIQRVNPSAERLLGRREQNLLGTDVQEYVVPSCRAQLVRFLDELHSGQDTRQLWIPRSLEVAPAAGAAFPAEATLSRFESGGAIFYTLILRNVDERLAAERRIRELTQEAEYLQDAVRDLRGAAQVMGRSRVMLELLDAIGRVAPTDATVLILGETGTGKELVAREIHRQSRRAGGPLIRVNCAAIPGELIESEFFGHEKGAFTGATSRREGRFALADKGTIFLDEIGELPLDLQAKLLRVLQEGEFEAVGSAATRNVDVRVVAATNRDLDAMVAHGRFREDLYYRLSVFPLSVPPLRQREQDVEVLASVFLERFAHRMGRRFEPLGTAQLARLHAYGWPGNVRELQNVIERAIILSQGSRLDLERAMPQAASPPAQPISVPVAASDESVLTAEQMQACERQNIERALAVTCGRISGRQGAAALLGMPPSTLNSRIKALGIRHLNRR